MRLPGLSIGGTIVATALVTSLVNNPPAYAAGTLARIESAVSCATSGACVSGSNTTSGPGVSGTSAKGYGVEGVSTSNDGLKGISTSSNGLSGSSKSAFGAKGISSTSYGVYGASVTGGGVYGETSSTKVKQAGVMGVDRSSNGTANDGVYGTVTNGGWGVEGTSLNGASGGGVTGHSSTAIGVAGESYKGYGVFANSITSDALYATTQMSLNVAEFYSSYEYGSGISVGAVNNAIYGQVSGQGNPLVLSYAPKPDVKPETLFYVDYQGNVYNAGSYQSIATTQSGATVESYGTKTTRPTVEDTGTAHLSGGSAAVPLDATFAGTIDPTSGYRVFITPDGETRGLFVASKSMRGFTVREVQGGRSSTDFDYRIVAIAAGHAGQHMARIDPASIPQHAMMKRNPMQLLTAAGR